MITLKSLLRRGEARRYLEVSDRQFRRLLRERRLVPRHWQGRGRALYLVVELRAIKVQSGESRAEIEPVTLP